MKAKKETSRIVEGDIETIKFHIIEVKDIVQEEIDELYDYYKLGWIFVRY